MARLVRIEFPGAVYHVTARGNERRRIYQEAEDYKLWLEALVQARQTYGWKIHGYCLMANHYHLLVETPSPNLSKGMAWLQTSYTVRYNRRHRRVGHLFQGRYKAQIVDTEGYIYEALLYVHLNPVRLKQLRQSSHQEKVRILRSHLWSSHPAYAGITAVPDWLSQQWLRHWGSRQREARENYSRVVLEKMEAEIESPWRRPRAGCYVGGEELWNQVKKLLQGKDLEIEQQAVWREQTQERLALTPRRQILARPAASPHHPLGRTGARPSAHRRHSAAALLARSSPASTRHPTRAGVRPE